MVQLRSYRRGVVASGGRGVRSRRSSALRGACPADLLSSGAGSGEQGQAQRDLRSPAQATHGLDAPSVRLDDGLGYRQAEPGASQPARTGLLKAVEALEDARQLFSGYSRAAILHADIQLAGADERGEGNRTPGRAVLGGVVYQYKHGLLHPLGIYLDESSAFQLSFQLGAMLAGERLSRTWRGTAGPRPSATSAWTPPLFPRRAARRPDLCPAPARPERCRGARSGASSARARRRR